MKRDAPYYMIFAVLVAVVFFLCYSINQNEKDRRVFLKEHPECAVMPGL